jgi:GntR family transcriptional regulator
MIDSALALPLYHQVAGILRQRIEDGIYPVGARLLSEDELAAEFEVSRATIRQAIGELVMDGRVVRRQGRGTYVQARDKHILQQRYRGSLDDLIGESHRAKTRNIELERDVFLPSHVAEALQLDVPRGTVVRRTRTMHDQPFAYTITFLPPDLGRKITTSGLRRKALMELLIDDGIILSSATQRSVRSSPSLMSARVLRSNSAQRSCWPSGSCTIPPAVLWNTSVPGTAGTATSTPSRSTWLPARTASPT